MAFLVCGLFLGVESIIPYSSEIIDCINTSFY